MSEMNELMLLPQHYFMTNAQILQQKVEILQKSQEKAVFLNEEPWCNAKLSWNHAKVHLPGCYQELNYSIKLLPLCLSVRFHFFPPFLSLPALSLCLLPPPLHKLRIHLYLYPPHTHHSSFAIFLHLLV